MTDLTPDHPAVEAAARVALKSGWTCDTHEPEEWGVCPDCTTSHLRTAHRALTAALPHLTGDDLRNTPAGKQLLAEGWEAACRKVIRMAWADSSDAEYLADEGNPYRKDSDA